MIHPAQQKLEHEVMRWVENHPDATSIPHFLSSTLDKIQRYDAMNKEDLIIKVDPYQIEEIRTELESSLPGYAERRDIELQLSEYINKVGTTQLEPNYYEIALKLEQCRTSGAVGIKPDGGSMVAWDTKCGMVRLCPDESREETQRLAEWYLPPMLDFTKINPSTHRIFYGVFTLHNFRPGHLKTGKKYLIEKFNEWRKQYKNIEGALIIQEDPLSASDDWNIHLNVFLLVNGRFDYDLARERWGANVHFNQIKGEPKDLTRALLEAIKYSAQFVPGKSAEHADSGKSEAPAMIEWPHERWDEWYQAGKGFRRVRSYGCLYKLHQKLWDASAVRERINYLSIAELSGQFAVKPWKELTEVERPKLRKAMTMGEPLDMSLVQWIGAVNFNDNLSYSVDLIPGDNFSGVTRQQISTHNFKQRCNSS